MTDFLIGATVSGVVCFIAGVIYLLITVATGGNR